MEKRTTPSIKGLAVFVGGVTAASDTCAEAAASLPRLTRMKIGKRLAAWLAQLTSPRDVRGFVKTFPFFLLGNHARISPWPYSIGDELMDVACGCQSVTQSD